MSEQVIVMNVDRKDWPAGPWDNEPDRVQWVSGPGYAALIVRNAFGSLCGYIGVPNGHPAYGKNYDDVDVNVHGGLTYGNTCAGHVCHVPEPGMPSDVYWLGFDCAHAGDADPKNTLGGVYRTLEYVRNEVEGLALQLKELENSGEQSGHARGGPQSSKD